MYEYRYINKWLINQQQKCHGKIQSSDKYIDFLTNHFRMRQKIYWKLERQRVIDCKLSKKVEYLFDYLIKLRKTEGTDPKIDEDKCLKYIEKAKHNAINEGNWSKVSQQLRTALQETRLIDIELFLNRYKIHKTTCKSLKHENTALFITGAGKSMVLK